MEGGAEIVGDKIFPERRSPSASTVDCNRFDAHVTLKKNVPAGMKATVHLTMLDPINSCISSLYGGGDDFRDYMVNNASEINIDDSDNIGTASLIKQYHTSTINATYRVKIIQLRLVDPHLGDNYLLCIHPNDAAIRKGELADPYPLLQEQLSNRESIDIRAAIQAVINNTEITESADPIVVDYEGWSLLSAYIEVWRTLWVELDRMEMPLEGQHGFLSNEKYTPGATGDRGIIAKNKWMDGNANTILANEPEEFDVRFQPPKPDISLVVSALEAACIVVREATPAIITSWGLTSRETMPFVRNMTTNYSSEVTTIGNQSRNVTMHGPDFWCIQGIGAYEHMENSDHDKERLAQYGGAVTNDTGIFIVYNETIRDRVSTDYLITNPVTVHGHTHFPNHVLRIGGGAVPCSRDSTHECRKESRLLTVGAIVEKKTVAPNDKK